MSNLIKVPKPSRAAYNPHRVLDERGLIATQVQHFFEAEQQLPEHLRTGIDINAVKTEGQASHYIRMVTRAIHETGGRPPEKVQTGR